jgi:hypothetical protein
LLILYHEKGGKKMQMRGTNPKPTTSRPSNPRIQRLHIEPEKNIKRIYGISLKVLKIIEDEKVTEDEFYIIEKMIENEFKRLKE